jgi:hypothetical protein
MAARATIPLEPNPINSKVIYESKGIAVIQSNTSYVKYILMLFLMVGAGIAFYLFKHKKI